MKNQRVWHVQWRRHLVAGALLLCLGGVFAFWTTRRTNSGTGVAELIRALDDSEDAAFEEMSERYRSVNDIAVFRRALGRVSELRSADSTSAGSTIPLSSRPDVVGYCGHAAGVDALIRARLVWEGNEWQVDALAIETREIDESETASDVLCPVTRR